MEKFDLTVSIVTYFDNNYGDIELFKKCIQSVLSSNLNMKVFVVDNSTKKLDLDVLKDKRVEYIFNGKNIGFGRAHNKAIKKIYGKSTYHLILNPDIYFEKNVLTEIKNFMDKNKDVVALIPKVLYPDGRIQYLCKLLPTPIDLIFRRFIPSKKYLEKRNYLYELRFTNYKKIMDVPVISGCFMYVKTDILEKLKGFDERFFLYLEDVDLCRRMLNFGRIVFYPNIIVFHKFERGSYKKFNLLLTHMISAVKYFNKWGWLFDRERNNINKKFLKKLL